MYSIRQFFAARRVLAASVTALGLAAGLAVGAPAAHAGTGCTWAPINLVNGWQSEQSTYDTGDPSVCLENDGMVYLSGSVAAPSGGASSAEFGTLPVWDWPTRNLYFDVYTMNGSYGVLRIDTDGTIWAYGGLGGASQYTSLAGISYPDAAVTQTDLPLENGWQSADSLYDTGDPAYSITSGIVHLSGSLWRPAGSPSPGSNDWAAAVAPVNAYPSDICYTQDTYTFGGGISRFGVSNWDGTVWGANAQYASLAGVNYPTAPTAWQSLPLLSGSNITNGCYGLSYFLSGNVVYLYGTAIFPAGFSGEIAVLPPQARPSHYLYMIASNDGAGTTPSDFYDVLRIQPDGSMWLYCRQNLSSNTLSLSGMSFHLQS